MQKIHTCEEKYSKCVKELTLFNNCKFVSSSRIIVQQKMNPHAWQPSFDQPLSTNSLPQVIGVTYCWKGNFISFQRIVIVSTLL